MCSNQRVAIKEKDSHNVIMPDYMVVHILATLISKPDVVEFIDFLSGEQGQSIHMESVGFDELPAEIKDKPLRDVMG